MDYLLNQVEKSRKITVFQINCWSTSKTCMKITVTIILRPYVVVVFRIIQIPAVSFLKPALFSRNLWPPHQKYSRISLKVFFFISFFKEFYHLERKGKKLQIYAVWQFFAQPPCRYFPRIILKLLLFWFLRSSFLESCSCRCLLIFFRCKLLQKTFSSRVCEGWCRCLKKKFTIQVKVQRSILICNTILK